MCGVAVSGSNSRFLSFISFSVFCPSITFGVHLTLLSQHNTFLSIFGRPLLLLLIQYSARFTHFVRLLLYISMEAVPLLPHRYVYIILSQTAGTKRSVFRHTCVKVDARPRFFLSPFIDLIFLSPITRNTPRTHVAIFIYFTCRNSVYLHRFGACGGARMEKSKWT